jgi:hypothetical protein
LRGEKGNPRLNQAFLIQTAASAAAVAVLVGLAAWAKIAKPGAPLDEARARKLLAEDFPGRTIEEIWVAVDGKGALAKSGATALLLCELGDGYVCRQVPWAQALAASFRDGRITVNLADVGAPKVVIALTAWPPKPPPTGLAA